MAVLVFIIFAVLAGALIAALMNRPAGNRDRLQDAEAEARRWVDRLGAGVTSLSTDGTPAATQALADAAERHMAAGAQLAQARSAAQFALASHTAIEGLHYLRAARTALNLDPGPPIPDLTTETVDAQRRILVGNEEYLASPHQAGATPYYYPGGMVRGRQVPAGWYNTPWWKTALVAGAAGVGGAILADTLLEGFHHHGGGFFGPDGLF